MIPAELHRGLAVRNAWQSTSTAALINVLGMFLEFEVERAVPGVPMWPPLMSAGGGVAILAILFLRRKNPSLRLCSSLFLVNASVISLALFVSNPYFAATGSHWVPFQAAKLGCLIAGFLAPSLKVGLAAIAIHGGFSVLQFANFSPAIQAGLAGGEPWATMAFSLAGAQLLWFRMRWVGVERDLIHAQANMDAMKDLARAFLQLRDMMNTPLQTIGLTIEVLRQKNPNEPLERAERALERLREINLILVQHEEKIVWEGGDLTLSEGKSAGQNDG